MTTRSKEITNTITEYIAEDGTVFSDKTKCEYHEWKSKATAVWAVSLRGQRTSTIEVYSTEELAKKATWDSTYHTTTKIYLDQRLWDTYESDVDFQEARKHFFSKEGYMGTDKEAATLYKKDHHGKDT